MPGNNTRPWEALLWLALIGHLVVDNIQLTADLDVSSLVRLAGQMRWWPGRRAIRGLTRAAGAGYTSRQHASWLPTAYNRSKVCLIDFRLDRAREVGQPRDSLSCPAQTNDFERCKCMLAFTAWNSPIADRYVRHLRVPPKRTCPGDPSKCLQSRLNISF